MWRRSVGTRPMDVRALEYASSLVTRGFRFQVELCVVPAGTWNHHTLASARAAYACICSWLVQLLVLLEHFEYNKRCKKFFTNLYMMSGRVVFSPIVGIIRFAGSPEKFELFLAFSVA